MRSIVRSCRPIIGASRQRTMATNSDKLKSPVATSSPSSGGGFGSAIVGGVLVVSGAFVGGLVSNSTFCDMMEKKVPGVVNAVSKVLPVARTTHEQRNIDKIANIRKAVSRGYTPTHAKNMMHGSNSSYVKSTASKEASAISNEETKVSKESSEAIGSVATCDDDVPEIVSSEPAAVEEELIDENDFDEKVIDEKVIDENIIDENIIDEKVIDEKLIDEKVIDTSDQAVQEDTSDRPVPEYIDDISSLFVDVEPEVTDVKHVDETSVREDTAEKAKHDDDPINTSNTSHSHAIAGEKIDPEIDFLKIRAIALAETIEEVRSVLQEGLTETYREYDVMIEGESDSDRKIRALKIELSTRAQAEAVRLSDCLHRQERKIRDQYEGMFNFRIAQMTQQQVIKFKEDLKEQEEKFIKEMEQHDIEINESWIKKMENALERMSSDMDMHMHDELRRLETDLTKVFEVRELEHLETLREMRNKFQAAQDHVKKHSEYRKKSKSTRMAVLSTLSLVQKLSRHEYAGNASAAAELGPALLALSAACPHDRLVQAAIRSIPQGFFMGGVPTKIQLANKLRELKNPSMKVAFIPQGTEKSVLGRALGTVTSLLLTTPREGSPDFVNGDSSIAIFTRAESCVAMGDVEGAVFEVEKLQSHLSKDLKNVTGYWLKDARRRIALDRTMTLLQAHISLMIASTFC